jgi:hypothetical protein
MKLTHEILLLLRNTFLVTLAVVLGFTIGGILHIPASLQVVCLIPAGWLFYRLSGEKAPRPADWIPLFAAIALILQCGFLLVPLVPDEYRVPVVIFLILLAPVRPLERLIRRLMSRFEPKSEA